MTATYCVSVKGTTNFGNQSTINFAIEKQQIMLQSFKVSSENLFQNDQYNLTSSIGVGIDQEIKSVLSTTAKVGNTVLTLEYAGGMETTSVKYEVESTLDENIKVASSIEIEKSNNTDMPEWELIPIKVEETDMDINLIPEYMYQIDGERVGEDDLGSPMRLTDEDGRSEEVYGFDEFGNDIRTAKDIFKDSLQSFGFTGYQMDSVGALYFAQARRYDTGVGRFISEDFIKGHIAAPYTMNHYNYCWNRPLDLVDLNGMEPTAGVIKALMDMLKCDETVSYIFYTTGENSDFTDQANWKKEQLESEGKNVVMIPIANANDFVDGWNHMGMTPDGIANIEDVEIYTHSNETTFIFIDNTETEALSISGKNKSGKAIKGISDLSYKEIR